MAAPGTSSVADSGAREGAAARATADASTAATEEEALAAARRSGKNVEVLSLRGESSDTFATPGGHLEAREYLRPVRTRIDGTRRPVDTALAKAGDGMVAPKAATVGLEFSGGGTGRPLVRLERAGRTLELSWPGTVPAPALDGGTAVYRDILPDVDLRLGAGHRPGPTGRRAVPGRPEPQRLRGLLLVDAGRLGLPAAHRRRLLRRRRRARRPARLRRR
ncbi:hypothetical protein ACFV2H_09785 [Streptomyces sp. NPDC059629]|uniref:hypothetical protein n=1 Tax=Streptomyces sp. NPDC059629 TaxID=3346889 RepID=UPI0036AEF042